MNELLTKPAPLSKGFRSLLEYLLFRGAFFDLPAANIYRKNICLNHIEALTLIGENRGRCTVCKPVRKQQTANNVVTRRVSKELA